MAKIEITEIIKYLEDRKKLHKISLDTSIGDYEHGYEYGALDELVVIQYHLKELMDNAKNQR